MNVSEVKQNILHLSDSIARRSEIIDKQKGERNLLEIDLAMEDIRFLYREMERLKLLINQDIAPSKPSSAKAFEQNPSGKDQWNSSFKNNNDKEEKIAAVNSSDKHTVWPDKEQQTVHYTQETSNADAASTSEKQSENISQAKKEQQEVRKEPEPVKQEETIPKNTKPEIASTEETKPIDAPRQNESRNSAVPSSSSQKSDNHTPVKSLGETIADKKTVIADKFGSSPNSIYERLSKIKEDHSIGAKMQQKPVANIKSAIGINEKFLFINELFNGDIRSYNDSVDKLNNFSSIHEAFEYLNLLTDTFQWDGNRSSETIEKFANLVQRRFM